MIDFDRKILFIHIPKCAGTSIKKSRLFSDNSLEVKDLPAFKKMKNVDRRYAAWMLDGYKNYFRVLQDAGVDSSFKSVAILRNPWERILSYWTMLNNSPKQYSPLKGLSFEEFVKDYVGGSKGGRERDAWHVIPASTIITAYQNVFESDVGLLFDISDITAMLPLLCDYLEAPNVSLLPKKNTTKHGSCSEHYTGDLVDTVGKVYCEDTDMFGWGFNK